ncbi:hypothetical protein [uncultured Cohaesibacter sp.]|uniref:hypothetical protein n=1 Tax=uncultured Cohaesibacter sp. TaxID=1002546 RepID=UPI002AAA842E|nr:hypothetical protein [uncultured Cohaesibacter sp.]
MKTPTARQHEDAYNERLKALRRGDLNVDIFRMMGSDVPLPIIAHRLEVYPYHLGLFVDRVFNSFREPDDSIKPFPWEKMVIVK